MEQRAGKDARGTVGHVITKFEESTEFEALAASTREDYEYCAKTTRSFKTKQGPTLDTLQVDRLSLPSIQSVIEKIAKGSPESKPGAGDAVPPYPSKANHLLRYLRRLFAWGMRHGHCKTNPAEGAKEAKEVGEFRMPEHDAYQIALMRAKEGGALKAHTKGSCPPYLWCVMEISYLCRMRGIEVVSMTDAHATDTGLRIARRKGSNDNIVSWTPRLRAAWEGVLAIRAATFTRPALKGRPVPIRREDRYVFVDRSGGRLKKNALKKAWQDFMRALVKSEVLTPEQRFGLHGLKHRGITDTPGNKAHKQTASGHKTLEALGKYDHEVPVVQPANAPNFPENFPEASGEES